MTDSVVQAPGDEEAAGRGRGVGTARFVLTKIGGGLISLLLVVVLGFFLFRELPGNPVRAITSDTHTSLEQMEQLRAEWSLDKPLLGQLMDYLGDLAHGDLGTSFKYRQPVSDLIMTRLGPTLLLTGTELVLAVLLGLWLGTRRAGRHGSRFEPVSTGTALLLVSVPSFRPRPTL